MASGKKEPEKKKEPTDTEEYLNSIRPAVSGKKPGKFDINPLVSPWYGDRILLLPPHPGFKTDNYYKFFARVYRGQLYELEPDLEDKDGKITTMWAGMSLYQKGWWRLCYDLSKGLTPDTSYTY